jgi:hypothetical protein
MPYVALATTVRTARAAETHRSSAFRLRGDHAKGREMHQDDYGSSILLTAPPELLNLNLRAVRDDQENPLGLRRRGRRGDLRGVHLEEGPRVTARLIVRRVRALNPRAASGQGELFPAWRAVCGKRQIIAVTAPGHQ